jgi:hypothetical protein
LDIEEFRKFIRVLCQSNDIKFIAEEMTDEGLKEYSVQETICQSIALELDIDILPVDIDQELREKIGIDDLGLSKAAIPDGQLEPDEALKKSYNHNLSNPIRECSWLAHIIINNSWPTLLVCRANHVKGVIYRAQNIGVETAIVSEDYKP